MKYLIVVEKGETSFGAYSPDIPGCFATGATAEEAEQRMLNAIEGYLEYLRDEGQPAPAPTTAAASFVHVVEPEAKSDTGHAA